MSGHTPGPWHINRAQVEVIEGKLSIESEGGYFIAQVDEGWEQNGNANLIAAAPELLDALVKLESAFTDADITSREYRHKARLALIAARAAIAKATNQQGNNHD